MRSKSLRVRAINKSVRVSGKRKYIKRKTEPVQEPRSITKQETLNCVPLQNSEKKEKINLIETPNKGFRPFELSTPVSFAITPTKSIHDSARKSKIEENEASESENPAKKKEFFDPPEIWSRGIENVTYCTNEFEFASFPIQF